jgi:uncharacterized protein YjbI with pentapeptide repeats
MLRYIFLSVFALLLLTACGDGSTDQEGAQETVTDTSSKDLNKAFENKTGSLGYGETEPTPTTDPFPTPLKEEALPSVEVSVLVKEVGNDLDKLIETKSCPECDLSGADLTRADLTGAELAGANLSRAILNNTEATYADLTEANLTEADLSDSELDGVMSADFTGTLNVNFERS